MEINKYINGSACMHTNQISHLPIHKFTEMDQNPNQKIQNEVETSTGRERERNRGTDLLGRKEGYVRIRLTGHS